MKISLFLMIFVITTFLFSASASATWWNTDYDYRKTITLTGNASGAQTNYQLLLNVTYDSDMQEDFDDLRFTNNTHQIDAWLELKVNSSYALIWVEFPTTPEDGIDQDYYMYYGNNIVSSDWDGNVTFISFFDGSSTDWIEVDPNSHISFVNHRLEWSGLGRNENAYVYQTKTGANNSIIFEYTFNNIASDDSGLAGFGLTTNTIDDMANIDYGIRSFWVYKSISPVGSVARYISGASTQGGDINVILNTQYWVTTTIDRAGNSVTKIYSDSARTTQVGADSIIDVSGVTATLQYIYMLNSYNDASALYCSGWLDDFKVRKYAANPATYIFDSEDSKTTLPTITALQKIPEPIILIKDKFFNIIPFIISIILFAGFGLTIMVMTSRLKKW